MMFYRHTLPYWSRGNYKQVLKNWKIAINSPTYVISNYNFMANLMMVGPTSYPKMIWSFLKYITKIMNYDFLSPGDKKEAKILRFKEKVSEIICQLEENAPKNYIIPFSYANDVDIGVILNVYILIPS